MKSIIITFNQAYYDDILSIMNNLSLRGFTYWEQVQGRGSKHGEPRYGNHTWPEMNSAMMVIVEDYVVDNFLEKLRDLDQIREALGLRAFVTNVEKAI